MADSSKAPHSLPSPSLIPYLVVRDCAKAIDFYKAAFGAEEDYRLNMGDVIGHAELTIGGARLMLADEFPKQGILSPESLGGAGFSMVLYVEDVDASTARAEGAGATIEKAPADQFHGDRQAWVKDPFGHRWSLSTRVHSYSSEEIIERFKAVFPG